jgi:hypothetical protein
MHASKPLSTLFTLLVAVALAPNAALAQSLLIDDFTTGDYQVDAYPSAPDSSYQIGAMLGGIRSTYLSATATLPQHQRPASLSIPVGGPLIIDTGFQVKHRLELVYGLSPLNLDTRVYSRLRVWFDGLDKTENFNIVLWAANGARYYQLGLNLSANENASCVDFPLDNFGKAGIPEADRADIDSIALILQSGSAMGAADFALRSVSLVGPKDAGSASCTIAQW